MTIALANISKSKVKDIPSTAPLVSITDPWGGGPDIPNRENRLILHLNFLPGDYCDNPEQKFQSDHARKLKAFVENAQAQGHETVFIHCGEGRIRSYSLCAGLEMELRDVEHDVSYMDRGVSGDIDRYTYHLLRTTLRADALDVKK